VVDRVEIELSVGWQLLLFWGFAKYLSFVILIFAQISHAF
jgi:hypothetical protein